MITFVLSEIYGKTPEFLTLCAKLPGQVVSISPYQDEHLIFDDEQFAYQHFIENVGVEGYCHVLKSRIEKAHPTIAGQPINLVGFSVGASAIWQMCLLNPQIEVNKAMLFYGAQIRHLLDDSPRVACHLILPREEAHFSVDELSSALKTFQRHILERSHYLHGFMNKCSSNFNEQGYQHYLGKIANLLSAQ